MLLPAWAQPQGRVLLPSTSCSPPHAAPGWGGCGHGRGSLGMAAARSQGAEGSPQPKRAAELDQYGAGEGWGGGNHTSGR